MFEKITSVQNEKIKVVNGLIISKKERDISGSFVCEGIKLCMSALQANVKPEQLYFTENALDKYKTDINMLIKNCDNCFLIGENVADKLSDTKSTQGIFAVWKKPLPTAINIVPSGHYIAIHDLQDSGNIGTVIRTACALGFDGVFVSKTIDIYSPKILRCAMGGVFGIPMFMYEEATGLIAELKKTVPVYAAALTEKAVPLKNAGLKNGACVFIGNEGNGLPQHIIDDCSSAVIIPMSKQTQSLNAAIAAAIIMWECI